ncbi:MAG: cellulase family glycosylhydrolase [Acidimicrobiales bacterium]
MAAVLFVAVACVATSCGSSSQSAPSSATGEALAYLHVVIPPTTAADASPYLADPAGRQVLLHGAAVVGMQDVAYPNADGGPAIFPLSASAYDGKCPAASALIPQPPLCEVEAGRPAEQQSAAPGSGDDFAQMRALGFNVIRLVLNWSQLEPTPGVYSSEYLQRVQQVVGWAGQQGIYVILDMHQDQYSRYILPGKPSTLPSGCTSSGGSDGAPSWAVFTDGKPACALFGESDLNPAVSAAFYNFWHNQTVASPRGAAPGSGLQDHYIGALVALARTFEHNPTVLGYEVMNEPQPGSLSSLPLENLYQASSQDLFPFYQRVVEALTGVRDGLPTCPAAAPSSMTNACAYPELADVARQQIFVEPIAYRNLLDFSPQVSRPFTHYRNLVWAPHIYTHAFTLDQFVGYPAEMSPFPPDYTFGYQTAEYEARAMHAAVFTTEFGDSSSTDDYVLAGETSAQESTLTGGTVWAWKGLSATTGTCWCVRWQHSTYQTTANGQPGTGDPHVAPSPDDLLIPSRQEQLARVWPRATAGTLLAEQYDPTSRAFDMAATDSTGVPVGDRGAETVVYIPSTVGGAVTVTGAAILDTVVRTPDGSRIAYVAPTGTSNYGVTVGSPGTALIGAVSSEATNPLPAISEAQARQVAEQAIAEALASSNPTIAGNAGLAGTLGTLLLGTSDPAAG